MSYTGYRKGNKHKVFEDRIQVYLKDGTFFLVDLADWELVSGSTWGLTTGTLRHGIRGFRYVCTYIPDGPGKSYKTIYLHKLLLGAPSGLFVDHIDGDVRNNMRSNLRVVTRGENVKNQRKKSGKQTIPCVTFDKSKNKYRVRLRVDGKNKHFAWCATKLDAEALAIKLKNQYYGEYSPHWKESACPSPEESSRAKSCGS